MSQLLTIFSAESSKQWNYTVEPVAMETSQAWDKSTPTYMCSLRSLLSTHGYTVHIKGHGRMCCLPYFHLFMCWRREYVVWDMKKKKRKKHRYRFCPWEDSLAAPCWMSGFPQGRQRSFEITLCFGAVWLLPLQRSVVHTRAARYCLRCLLPGGHKLIIHTLSHQCSHTYCNPDIPAPLPCSVNSCKCLFL